MVEALATALDADPTFGIVSPVVVSRENPDLVESIGIRYSPRTGRMRHVGFGQRLSALETFDVRAADGVSGVAMLVRREVFDRIGLFTEDYFFGYEDLDFCLRARAAGFRSASVGTAIVEHRGSGSMGKTSSRRHYYATRNHLLLASRFSPPASGVGRLARSASIVVLNLANALITSDVPRGRGVRGVMQGFRDYRAGRFGSGTFEG
jgi:GT2 family glycosyltransferase